MNWCQISKRMVLLVNFAAATATSPVWAAGDMLTPNEVQTTGISANPANDSGVFFGGGLKLGQARSTDGGSSPGVASFVYLEPGYQASTGSWSRFEVSAELFSGSLNFRLPTTGTLGGKSALRGLNGVVAKVGHGYSLGSHMFGVVKAGVGTALGTYEVDTGTSTAKSDRTTGLVWLVGWQLVAPVSKSFDATAGVTWTQFQFDVDSVTASGTKFQVGRQLLANVPGVDLGVRLRF